MCVVVKSPRFLLALGVQETAFVNAPQKTFIPEGLGH